MGVAILDSREFLFSSDNYNLKYEHKFQMSKLPDVGSDDFQYQRLDVVVCYTLNMSIPDLKSEW